MKKLIFLSITMLCISSFFASAQINPPAIQWQNTIGGSSYENVSTVIQTEGGRYLIGGSSYFGTSSDKSEPGQGRYDYWIVQLDENGTVLFEHTYGGDLDDYLKDMIQTPDGGYLLGGYSISGITGDKTSLTYGSADYWIVKLNNLFEIEWQQSYGGNKEDFLSCIANTPDGGYLFGGTSYSGIAGVKTEQVYGKADYWVIKTDNKGDIEWQNTIGGSRRDYLYTMENTNDGGYILGGQSVSPASGDKAEGKFGGGDYWVVKLDNNGTISWENTIAGNQYETLTSVDQTPDDGYLLCGYSNSAGLKDKSENCKGEYDYWVIKLNSNGVIEWDKTIGGSDAEWIYDVELTSDGGYILGGFSKSGISGDKKETARGGYDYWVVKVNNTGTIEWQKTIGGSGGYDLMYSILQCSDGGYILAGSSDSGISGDKTEASQGASDYWVIKLEPLTCNGWTVYVDADNDGYGDPGNSFFTTECILPPGYIADGTDCNDADAAVHPMVNDICYNFIDDNCDGVIDENCTCDVPVNLSSFEFTATTAQLSWKAVTNATIYKVQYKVKKSDTWTTVKVVDTNTVVITGLAAATEYAWQVRSRCAKDPDVLSDWSKKNFFFTNALKEGNITPASLQIYPNPASGNSVLHFSLANSSRVTLSLFDVNGKELNVFLDEPLEAGNHSIPINTLQLSQGIYFVRLMTADGIVNEKLIVE